jgi:hypothetical protein
MIEVDTIAVGLKYIASTNKRRKKESFVDRDPGKSFLFFIDDRTRTG